MPPPPELHAAGAAHDESAELDVQVRQADPDRWLATRFIADPMARADVVALYAYDAELARAPRATSNTLMAEIRLTWWREVLDQIFGGEPVRRHPVAQALAAIVTRHALSRPPLEAMIDARIEALDPAALDAAAWADRVAGSAARLAAGMLDPAIDADVVGPAGRAWGLALLARQGLPLEGAALREALDAASRARVSVAAFPAIAHATLARTDLAGRSASDFGRQLRMLWAVARGRI